MYVVPRTQEYTNDNTLPLQEFDGASRYDHYNQDRQAGAGAASYVMDDYAGEWRQVSFRGPAW